MAGDKTRTHTQAYSASTQASGVNSEAPKNFAECKATSKLDSFYHFAEQIMGEKEQIDELTDTQKDMRFNLKQPTLTGVEKEVCHARGFREEDEHKKATAE